MEIRLEDLYQECEVCKGQKTVTERTGQPGSFGFSSAWTGPCRACRGQGGKLTPSGEAVAAFLHKLKGMGRWN